MSADDGKHWEAPRVWSRRDSIQASRDVNTKHTRGCQRRWDEMKNAGSVPGSQWHRVFGSSRVSQGDGTCLDGWGGGTGKCPSGHSGPPASAALLGGGSPPAPPTRAVNAGAEDPCKASCQRADSNPGSLRNVAAASSRAAGAGARFLPPDNSRAGASPRPPGRYSTPLSPRHAGTVGHESKPECFLSASLLPSRPPGLSCLHPMLQRVLIELQCLTSQRNPLLGKKLLRGAGGGAGTSLPWWWRAPALPGLLPARDLGFTGLLNLNLNYRSPYTGSVYLSI